MDWHHTILVFLVILLTKCSNNMVLCDITDVRLVGGPTSNKGTVEIRQNNGSWETTCGINLAISDVIVICRHLGFTGASKAIENTPYAQNSIPANGLQCDGADLSGCIVSASPCSSETAASTAGAASCHGEGYLGCFMDNPNDRVFAGDYLIQDQDMTISFCIKFCVESTTANYVYAGVENGEECFCSEASVNYTRYGVGSDANCHSSCLGDPTDSCGGSKYIAVFTISTVTPTTTTNTASITPIGSSSNNQAVITDSGSTAATSTPSTSYVTPQTTSALPLAGANTGLYGGIGGGVAAFIIIVIIIVIIFFMERRSRNGRTDPTSSQRMSLATSNTPTGVNGLGISNAALEETSAAGGSQLGLQASNNAAASVLTASGGGKSGLLVNLNPNKSMNIYGGIDDEVHDDGMMPYASFDSAATVQNNGRLSVVYAMPDKNGNDPRNDYEGITNEMAPYASGENVNPMRPRTIPNKTDRLSVVYAAPGKNGKGPRNDTSEDFGSLYAIPDKPRGQPDGNDDGIVHGLYAKADESSSMDQYEPDMVENEIYTV